MTFEEEPRKPRSRKKVLGVVLLVIVGGGALYWFVLDPLIHFELLVLYANEPYQWISNSEGRVRMVDLVLVNNGSKTLTIDKVWINGTLVDASEVRGYLGMSPSPGISIELFVLHDGLVFQDRQNYNFTVGTASGGRFTFVIPLDEAHKRQENITVLGVHFTNLQGDEWIGISVKNGPTEAIVIGAWVNGTAANVEWIWIDPSAQTSIIVDYGFRYDSLYVVRFETAVGNFYEISGRKQG